MDLDIIIEDWPYDDNDDTANVRKVMGVDGRPKVQVRVRSGLIQWEAEGRPDGLRPHGKESVLEHCEEAIRTEGRGASALTSELVEELVLELFDYYRRSQAFFHLGDYPHVLADVDHALRALSLLRHCPLEDTMQVDQYRPGLILDRARARMLLEVGRGDARAALDALNRGIQDVEQFYLQHELDEEVPDSPERQMLIELRRSLRERHNVPLDDSELLRSLRIEQEVAIRRENYEMAARLRDKINSLKQKTGIGE